MAQPDITSIALRLLGEQAEDSLDRYAAAQISIRQLLACPSVFTTKLAIDLQHRRQL